MKSTLALSATALLFVACASAPPLTFANLDADQDGLVSVASVAKADKYAGISDLTNFDADGDAQLNAGEFDAYLSSDFRQNAIQVAEQRRIERERQIQATRASSSGSSSGGYGS